ncbi:YciI family protein [Mycolicibacterium septicum]|uniref:YciI family protein n=1 Tax=Mycolicibacterium septicum TaxID=98668 RepID=UPI001AF8CCDC|nr:YciI family protein [Mycolicibacterium septicum]QRY49077.1 GTP cyclohydrolase [Mycolicibacterium septicum]
MFHVLTTTYVQPVDVVDQTRPAHIAWLEEEVAAGRIVLAGRLESATGAVLITGDLSEEEVEDVIARDPYTLAGLIRCERTSFNGAFRAPGL